MANLSIYQLKITLIGSRPPIWRQVLVPMDFTFTGLHRVIQIAMGWENYHMHRFWDPNNFKRRLSEKINDHLVEVGRKVMYEYDNYDFGNGWEHEIELQRICEKVRGVAYPRCIAGERACPPEGCGGVRDYENLLEILAHPNHKEHVRMSEWVEASRPDGFHPELFDPNLVDYKLRRNYCDRFTTL